MINTSISLRINNEFSEYENYNLPIQLSLYKYQLYLENKDIIFEAIKNNKYKLNAVHLPVDSTKIGIEQLFSMIDFFTYALKCKTFVTHPNKGIEYIISLFSLSKKNSNLCVETFAYRKKKQIRSPLDICDFCIKNKNVWMTLDTTHIEEIWFDEKILRFLLKYTKVIHLSNRIGRSQHLPFNIQNGDLNLIKFVNDLKRFDWSGDLVLEYMPDYMNDLLKGLQYLQKLITN